MNKKVILFIVIVIIIASAIGLIYASSILKGEEINEDNHLVILNFDELENKVNNKETFILVITQTNCPHCLAYKPMLKKVLAKYDITAYEIQTDTISKEEHNKLLTIANYSGTPTTVFIQNGEEKNTANRIVGESSIDKIESRLKALGYIK